MTVKELFEFAKNYNLEDSELKFQDFCKYQYDVNDAIIDVSKCYQEQNKIILIA